MSERKPHIHNGKPCCCDVDPPMTFSLGQSITDEVFGAVVSGPYFTVGRRHPINKRRPIWVRYWLALKGKLRDMWEMSHYDSWRVG